MENSEKVNPYWKGLQTRYDVKSFSGNVSGLCEGVSFKGITIKRVTSPSNKNPPHVTTAHWILVYCLPEWKLQIVYIQHHDKKFRKNWHFS